MKKIAVFTGTRADYGLLRPLIHRIAIDENMDLSIIVTGTHLEKSYGETKQEIIADGFSNLCEVPMNLSDTSVKGTIHSMAREMDGLAEAYAKIHPDMIVILGDRYEAAVAALVAAMYQIPIAHIHGGEKTEGAVDDALRHAITKLSLLHFTSTEEYRRRVIQMGEPPERVWNVGALGVENIKSLHLMSREELCDKFGSIFSMQYFMITYHPVTTEPHTAVMKMKLLLESLQPFREYRFIFTYANADPEGDFVNQQIRSYVNKNPEQSSAFASMGQLGYLSALRYATLVYGNSSSGIIEAPSFHIPTVNVGTRQVGRVHGDSVITCLDTKAAMENALRQALSKAFRSLCKQAANPYEKDGTSERILQEIKKLFREKNTPSKKFFDIQIPF